MKKDSELRGQIFSLHEYHAYRLEDGSKNPAFDSDCKRILNLKRETEQQFPTAVRYYSKALVEFIKSNIDMRPYARIVGAVAPSHAAGQDSTGLISVMRHAANACGFEFTSNPLRRAITVEKLANGGDRSKEVHLRSIEIVQTKIRKGDVVILLDDVTTSGNTMFACEELLTNAGAQLVIKLALAETR